MPKSNISRKHAFFLGLMSLMVAVLCVTIKVVQENMEARIIMASIWVIIAIFWLIKSSTSEQSG